MRPGVLFAAIFTWQVCTGGRFTAPFLEEVAQFNESMIGLAFGLQILFGTVFASVGSKKADELELRYPGRGRVMVLMTLVFCGNIGIQIHFLVYHFCGGANQKSDFDEHDYQLSGSSSSSSSSSLDKIAIFHIIARIIFSICSAVVFPLLDGISLAYLKEKKANEADYGKERLFGAVGWAVASIVIGPTLDKYGYLDTFFWTSSSSSFICIFVIYLYMRSKNTCTQSSFCHGTCTRTIIFEKNNSMQIEKVPSDDHEGIDGDGRAKDDSEIEMKDMNIICVQSSQHGNDKASKSKLENSGEGSFQIFNSMFHTIAGVGFIISTVTLSMGTSVVENLIFLFFQELGASNTICGASVVVTVIFEVPIFQYSGQILEKLGAEALQKIACFAYVVRVVGYTFIPKDHVALVLLFEPLHGVTYACSKTSSVEFASKLSPSGLESTGQGVMSSLQGMGVIFGLSLGGWIEDTFSAVMLYRSYAIIVGLGLVVFYIAIFLDSRLKERVSYSSVL